MNNNEESLDLENSLGPETTNFNYLGLESKYQSALQLVDDVILKNYLANLSKLEVFPIAEKDIGLKNVRFFKITKMVYEKDEFAVHKFASVFNVFNSLVATESTIFLIVDSDGKKTDFYMGIRFKDAENKSSASYVLDSVKNSLKGQFPGITTTDVFEDEEMEGVISGFNKSNIASVSCVASSKKEEKITENKNFVQGLEKFISAMQGEKYTGIILANATSRKDIIRIRQGYENIYTSISTFATGQINYGTNESHNSSVSVTTGTSRSSTHTDSSSHTTGRTETKTKTTEESRENLFGKIGKMATAVLSTAAVVVVTAGTAGTAAPAAIPLAGAALGGTLLGKTKSESTSESSSESTSDTIGSSDSITTGSSESTSDTEGTSFGASQGKTLTLHNKSIENMLGRIDKQLKRLDECESFGMYECAAYFLSANRYTAEMAASTYQGLIRGENSGLEVTAINSWGESDKEKKSVELIGQYVTNFIHPVFHYNYNSNDNLMGIYVTPCALVSGNELAIHMGLPRHSVCGLPVVEHADFAKEIVEYEDESDESEKIFIGKIFNMGSETTNKVELDVDSLSMHTFITGSTGSGKSNAVCGIVKELREKGIKYLIVEPAKGEYKNFFGTEARVLGTNPDYTELLKINPFKFPNGVHVLEHVDRLVEIFNVCWPMYAAMPAVLKEAVLKSYEMCGWDLATSKNTNSYDIYPTFRDLLDQLIVVIDNSGYSEEVKSNYKGSLITRVKSLTNGLNGMIFSSDEIDNKILFDEDVVVDLSRVGSQETKSLLMGILVMRLSEHRMTHAKGANAKLKHITVLEEAHNLLRAHITATTEDGGNVGGKSVEMISNAIAEMRTYGEGFIIADQSPNAVDMSAIRNTNTKIILRLPEEFDRRVAGKAAALKDEQLDEIAKLPKGVAVVYQNDWVEPVLCKISKYDGEEKEYHFNNKDITDSKKIYRKILINWIIKNRLDNPEHNLMGRLSEAIEKIDCGIDTRMQLYALFKEHKNTGKLSIWEKDGFPVQAKLVSGILDIGDDIGNLRKISADMAGFRLRLNTIIGRKIDQPSDDEVISIAHCLLKEYSETNEGFNLYVKWREETEGRRHII